MSAGGAAVNGEKPDYVACDSGPPSNASVPGMPQAMGSPSGACSGRKALSDGCSHNTLTLPPVQA